MRYPIILTPENCPLLPFGKGENVDLGREFNRIYGNIHDMEREVNRFMVNVFTYSRNHGYGSIAILDITTFGKTKEEAVKNMYDRLNMLFPLLPTEKARVDAVDLPDDIPND